MKKITIAAALSAAFFAAPALAAENYYIGINAGQNDMAFDGVKASTAMGLFGGYSFNEYIAAELAYADFGKADTDSPDVTVKGNAASLAAVGSLPLGSNFSLFAKLGYASTKVEPTGGASESKDDITYGIGAQYNAMRHIAFRLGYDNYRVGKETTKDSALMSISALYLF